jgi:hypothetical protein
MDASEPGENSARSVHHFDRRRLEPSAGSGGKDPLQTLVGADWLADGVATNLLDIQLDCNELLRAGEVGEEEASAASRVLAILKKRWGDKPFTTRAVVSALGDANSLLDEEKAALAAELADSLGDLAGKSIDKPTARGLGKLFQKHLTNRPVWIDDGSVAVLRKVADHEANKYKVETQNPSPNTGRSART